MNDRLFSGDVWTALSNIVSRKTYRVLGNAVRATPGDHPPPGSPFAIRPTAVWVEASLNSAITAIVERL